MNEQKFDEWVGFVKHKYQVGTYCFSTILRIGVTLLIWGGAFWFGSLGWDSKQGLVFFVMGSGVWLFIFRHMAPDFWDVSLEVIGGWRRSAKSWFFNRQQE
jgi:hypothetical protein